MSFTPYQPTMLFASATAGNSHTGDTSLFTFATYTLKANTMAANDMIWIHALYTITNSANNKLLAMTIGGTSVYSVNVTVNATNSKDVQFMGRNSLVSQVCTSTGSPSSYGNIGARATPVLNLATDLVININGTLTNSGETITLQACYIKLFKFL